MTITRYPATTARIGRRMRMELAVDLAPFLPGSQRRFEQRLQTRLIQIRGGLQLHVTMNLAAAVQQMLRVGQLRTTRNAKFDAFLAQEQRTHEACVSSAVAVAEQLCGVIHRFL